MANQLEAFWYALLAFMLAEDVRYVGARVARKTFNSWRVHKQKQQNTFPRQGGADAPQPGGRVRSGSRGDTIRTEIPAKDPPDVPEVSDVDGVD